MFAGRREKAENGAEKEENRERRKGEGPLAALAVLCLDNGADTRFSPDLGQFLLDEYRGALPRYVVLDYRHTAGSDLPAFQEELRQKARKAGADVLVAGSFVFGAADMQEAVAALR